MSLLSKRTNEVNKLLVQQEVAYLDMLIIESEINKMPRVELLKLIQRRLKLKKLL